MHDHFYELPSEFQYKLDSSPKIENESTQKIKRSLPIVYYQDMEYLKGVKIANGADATKQEVETQMKALLNAIERLSEICLESAYPVNICRRRSNCCGLFMKSMFHETKQMGIVLRKSFKGTHIWIPPSTPNGVKIDAMFFTANEQPLQLDPASQTEENSTYLNYDTFILCNPNAMSYQHMINYPHAYYLKYFLGKQINCLIWNYRGYGRTGSTPNPMVMEQDA
jgi:hypothetical protein